MSEGAASASADVATLSRVEAGLTASATFAHRTIEFVRPQSAANARAPSVVDASMASKTLSGDGGTTVVVYKPATDGAGGGVAGGVNAKDEFKEPSNQLCRAQRVEAWLAWSAMRGIQRGLANLGNTCFLVRRLIN